MRSAYPLVILILSLGGGGLVYSAAPSKPDGASAAQPKKQSQSAQRAAAVTTRGYIGSTYVGTRSAAQGAGKPLAPGGAAFDDAQQTQAKRDGTQASADNGAGERISPARGTLATERPQPQSEQQSGKQSDQQPAQQPGQQSKQQPAQQSGQQSARQPAQQSDQSSREQSAQPATQQSAAQPSESQQAPQGGGAAAATQGAGKSAFDVRSTFRNICGFCHEDYGRHAGKGPQLMNSERSDEFIANRIKHGMPGRMPGFGSTFNDAQIQQIVKFIRALKPGEEPKNPA